MSRKEKLKAQQAHRGHDELKRMLLRRDAERAADAWLGLPVAARGESLAELEIGRAHV